MDNPGDYSGTTLLQVGICDHGNNLAIGNKHCLATNQAN